MSEVRVILPRELDKTLEALMKAGFAGNKAELVRTALVHFLSTLPTQLPKGYDLETAFSPDGRIFQLEYAVEATNKGGTILGINCHEGIVLAKEVKKDPFLVLPNPFLNIFKIHKQIGLAYSGILTDGHIVIKEAKQLITEMEKNEKVNITNLAKELVLFMQPFGQRKNYRPFGLAMILGGLDLEERPRLFLLNSGGLAQEYKACTVGVNREKVEKIVREEYSSTMSLEEALILAAKALLTEEKEKREILMATIDTKTKTFRQLTNGEKRSIIERAYH